MESETAREHESTIAWLTMDEDTRLLYLEAMGISAWRPNATVLPATSAPVNSNRPIGNYREASASIEFNAENNSEIQPTIEDSAENLAVDWETLQNEVTQCSKCGLYRSRTQTVFGSGKRNADWLLIGEAPGQQEDLQGVPFVGPAGQLLTEMLRAIGLERAEVYIANILKCRPPGNRDPAPEETEKCHPYLERQIALIQPQIILAVGRVAAQTLLQTEAPVSKLRGKVHTFNQTPLVVVYHPSYLLRSPLEKKKAWLDLQLAVTTFRTKKGISCAD